MAHMYPADGPAPGTASPAEIKLFHALSTLNDDYYVFHHTIFYIKEERQRGRRGRQQVGESDFIIAHPTKGLIALEIKGGEVHYEGKKFFTRPLLSTGEFSETTDPFEQARKTIYAVQTYLQRSPSTAGYADRYKIMDAVWFPDITWTQPNLLQYDRAQICDELDLAAPEQALDRVYAILKLKMLVPALDDTALRKLIGVLAPAQTIHKTLRDVYEVNRRRINQLTDEQVRGLLNMRLLQRIAFYGGAGTGKTILAFEMAARLADEGLRVLFLCYNREQAEFLRGNTHEKPSESIPLFDIRYPIMLYKSLADLAHQDPARVDALRITAHRDRQTMAAHMNEAIDILSADPAARPWRYDAIIVDEAQDVAGVFWTPIQRLLADQQTSRFYIFYDESQQFDLPAQELRPIFDAFSNKVPLQVNVRNTRKIYTLMREFNSALPETPPAIEGTAVEYINLKPLLKLHPSRDDAELAALIAALDRLAQEDVDARDILLITCRANVNSRLGKLTAIGTHNLRPLSRGEQLGFVKYSTIRSAKGLESSVVILAELDGLREDRSRSRLIYTAVSRARNHLIVLGTRNELRGSFGDRVLPHKKLPPVVS